MTTSDKSPDMSAHMNADENSDQSAAQDEKRDEETTESIDRVDATRAIEVEADEPRRDGVADLPGDSDRERDDGPATQAAPTTPGTTTGTVTKAPPAPSGPHVPAILLGIVCVAIASLVLAQELGDLTLDWGDIGPLGIALTGGVLVLFGLLGLATSRRKGS